MKSIHGKQKHGNLLLRGSLENDRRIPALREDDFLFCEISPRLIRDRTNKVSSSRTFYPRLPRKIAAQVGFRTGTSYEIRRVKPGVIYMAVCGSETGELGRAPLGEVAAEAAHHPPLRLFIDMTRLTVVAPQVSDDWTVWFKANQQSIAKVHALVESPLVQLTVTVSQLISRTGDLIRVHTDRAGFENALAQASPGT